MNEGIDKLMETESKLVVAQAGGKGKREFNASEVSSEAYENVLELDSGQRCTIL